MHSVASMPTHAQQTYTQSGAYPRNIPEQDLATKPAKKTRAIATSPRPRDPGEHDPEAVNVNTGRSCKDRSVPAKSNLRNTRIRPQGPCGNSRWRCGIRKYHT